MKIIAPAAIITLALTVVYLKVIELNLHWKIAKLYMLDAVADKLRYDFVVINGNITRAAMCLALISAILAIGFLFSKGSNKIIGVIVLLISGVSVCFSLLIA